ncbi:MAG: glycosyl hydrolase family 95 catalytic domain-containing protein [Lachnospiraceae bacterium]
MNYWAAESGALSECHLPFFELLNVCENGKKTAREMYGCRGSVHHNTDFTRTQHRRITVLRLPSTDGEGVPLISGNNMCRLWTELLSVFPAMKKTCCFSDFRSR